MKLGLHAKNIGSNKERFKILEFVEWRRGMLSRIWIIWKRPPFLIVIRQTRIGIWKIHKPLMQRTCVLLQQENARDALERAVFRGREHINNGFLRRFIRININTVYNISDRLYMGLSLV